MELNLRIGCGTRWSLPGWEVLLFTAALLVAPQVYADSPEGVEFFEKKVRPILVDNCYKCHSRDAEKLKGGLFLDSREIGRASCRERV